MLAGRDATDPDHGAAGSPTQIPLHLNQRCQVLSDAAVELPTLSEIRGMGLVDLASVVMPTGLTREPHVASDAWAPSAV